MHVLPTFQVPSRFLVSLEHPQHPHCKLLLPGLEGGGRVIFTRCHQLAYPILRRSVPLGDLTVSEGVDRTLAC